MKRRTREVEKRTFTLKNALPRFVSIVSRGANLTPLSELRFSEQTEKFGDVEINRIVFSKENYTLEQVEQYLKDNDYEDFSIEDADNTFVVPGVESDLFEEVSPIDYSEGVQFFVGKLKVETPNQANLDVTDSEVLDFQEPEAVEPTEEVVAESDEQTEPEVTDEEVIQQSAEADGEQGVEELQAPSEADAGKEEAEVVQENEPEVVAPEQVAEEVFSIEDFKAKANEALATFFSALEAARTESFGLPKEEVVTYTDEQVAELVEKAVSDAIAQYELDNTKETVEKPIDENTILVQNSQAVNTDEINTDSHDEPTADQFAIRKSRNLFGLR